MSPLSFAAIWAGFVKKLAPGVVKQLGLGL